jgi:very-short-patch-repair endonuclease
MEIQQYNQELRNRARDLRKKSTLSEVLLWNELKLKKLANTRFLRQRPINNYIVDFYCKELKLAIEVDGAIHSSKKAEDIFRQGQLESFGITFLRFSDTDVTKNISFVLLQIQEKILELKAR